MRGSVFFVEEFIGGYTLQKLLTEQMCNPYVKLYKVQVRVLGSSPPPCPPPPALHAHTSA